MITQSNKATNRNSESISVEIDIEESRLAFLQDASASFMQVGNFYFLIGWENLNKRKKMSIAGILFLIREVLVVRVLTWLGDISWPCQERIWGKMWYREWSYPFNQPQCGQKVWLYRVFSCRVLNMSGRTWEIDILCLSTS